MLETSFPRKNIQTVPKRNIYRFPKNSVTPRIERRHNRVTSRNIKRHRITGSRFEFSYFNMRNRMVHSHKRDAKKRSQHTRNSCTRTKARSQTWTLRKSDYCQVSRLSLSFRKGFVQDFVGYLSMVSCSFPRGYSALFRNVSA